MAKTASVSKAAAAQAAMEQLKAQKAEAERKKAELGKKRAKRITFNLLIMTVLLMTLGVLFSTFGLYYFGMLIGIGILPALVAYVTDTRKRRLASKTIMAMNFAGLFPYITSILTSGTPDQTALSTLKNPQAWLLIYGFASLGWALVYLVPHVAELYLEIKADFMVKKLQARQKELVEEWGESIMGGTAAPKK